MKIFIVEDEKPAADKLQKLLLAYDPDLEILGVAHSIRSATEALQAGLEPELMFMDIQLTDGLSFRIFDQVEAPCPIIFTTAFNEYAMEAFRSNGIDYLLKPITAEALAQSMEKLSRLRSSLQTPAPAAPPLAALAQALKGYQEQSFKQRFMVKVGEHIRSVTTDTILCFFAEGRTCYLVAKAGKYIIDYKLEDLTELLDPSQFFRVNRSFIVHINAIRDVLVYSNSRLKLTLVQEMDREIIVARDKVAIFKDWFDGNT